MGPRKRANYMNDLRHWAEMVGVKLDPGARELRRIDARPALRAALTAQEMGGFKAFHDAAYAARWCEARDISQPEVLGELLEKAGLDPQAALARAESKEIDERLDRQTQDAIDRGVFGLPTIFVGDEMFWGNDRFELVRFYIERDRK